jgi:hypothetical protein
MTANNIDNAAKKFSQKFLDIQKKILILKNLDDTRFLPVVIELLNEEIHKYNSKATKLYSLGNDTAAEKLEDMAEFYLQIKKNLINQK